MDQILLKMQTAQNLRFEDAQLAELFARSALEEAQALGYVSASLHYQLAVRSGSPRRSGRRPG